mgnify:FL=1
MKQNVISQMTVSDLEVSLEKERDTLVKLKLSHSVSPIENPLQIKFHRKNIARILTEIKYRKIKI